MMKRVVITVLLILVLAVTGCYRDIQEGAYTNISSDDVLTEDGTGSVIEDNVTVPQTDQIPEQPSEQITPPTSPSADLADVLRYRQAFVERDGYPYVLEVDEGELVKPVIRAVDPDQDDQITFRYGPPLDENGEWQTRQGMAGYYVVPITASDGQLDTTTDILVIVNSINRPPVIEPIADVIIAEGQTISFQPRVTDPDGDDFRITYTGWMTESTYRTTYDDAGVYTVNIIAADDFGQSVETVQVTVTDVNRAPIMGLIQDVAVDAGELVQINAVVADPDADALTVTYSAPLDQNGQWQTTESDVGVYAVSVTASDGDLETSQDVSVTVRSLNRPPVLSPLAPVIVNEGETIVLNPTAVDPDGDEVVISYSGWMSTNTYTTTYTDAGSYVVTITASDGTDSVSQNVVVTIRDVNRPPQFVFG